MAAYENKVEVLISQKSEADSALELKSRDIEDLKRSNGGFEKENMNLVSERSINLEQIELLSQQVKNLSKELQESADSYKELLEAKEAEAEKFQSGIDKLFKFKSQVKDLLVENKK